MTKSKTKRARTKGSAVVVRLYVAGNSPNSVRARANLQRLRDQYPEIEMQLEIVDVLIDSRRALKDRILVTPTLLKLKPPPVLRVIGDLGDMEQVKTVLRNS